MNNKKVILAVLILAILMLIGGSIYFFVTGNDEKNNELKEQNNIETDLSQLELTIHEYDYSWGKSFAYFDGAQPINTYIYNCLRDNCKKYDAFYPFVLIGDNEVLNIYNPITKENVKTNMPYNDDVLNNTRFALSDDINGKMTMYGIHYFTKTRNGFYDLNDKKMYYFDRKYNVVWLQKDFVDNHIWADRNYVIDYKTGKVLHEFETVKNGEGYNYFPIGNSNSFYYALTYHEDNDVYRKLYNKDFNLIFTPEATKTFSIDGVSNDNELYIKYSGKSYKIDQSGNRTLIQ